ARNALKYVGLSSNEPWWRCAMKAAHMMVWGIVVLSLSGGVYAQEPLKGEIATVDEASGKIGIKLTGTLGSSDATGPTTFKVEDGLIFNAVKAGDKVSFTSERVGEEMIVKKLTKD